MTTDTDRHTLLGDFLEVLGVPHTVGYCESRMAEMPFKTLFGFTKLLTTFGVSSEVLELSDKSEIAKLPTPFVAVTTRGLVIVTSLDAERVNYLSQGEAETMKLDGFLSAWTGVVLLVYPTPDSQEPGYREHAAIEYAQKAKGRVLAVAAVALLVYLFVANGLYSHVSTWLLTLFDLGGLYFTYLLVQKSLNIHNKTADRVCSVIQAGGCDHILELKASKFFGLFGWSEVGFAYFSVSLLTLLLLPDMLPWLALCNVCCLPFTVWSIWYQKFRARHWCTLCVCVQATLWSLFFCYLGGGWLSEAWPLSPAIIPLGLAYLCVLLGLNAIMPRLETEPKPMKE